MHREVDTKVNQPTCGARVLCIHALARHDTSDSTVGVVGPLLVLVGGVFVIRVASEQPSEMGRRRRGGGGRGEPYTPQKFIWLSLSRVATMHSNLCLISVLCTHTIFEALVEKKTQVWYKWLHFIWLHFIWLLI